MKMLNNNLYQSERNYLGTIYQGQTVTITLQTDKEDSLRNKDVYLGIYNEKREEVFLASTKDKTLSLSETDNKMVYICTLDSNTTKRLKGLHSIEMLMKSYDESFVSVCTNVIYFNVENRYIRRVLNGI